MKIEFASACQEFGCNFFDDETISVKLACSNRIDPDAADGRVDCNTAWGADPKQPIVSGSYSNQCGGGPVDACVALWQERNPATRQLYNCMNIEGASSCQKCSG